MEDKIKSSLKKEKNEVVFRIDMRLYTPEAVYSTAHSFIDRAYIYLDGDPASELIVSLKGKEKLNPDKLKQIEGEFLNELLNFMLRVEIAKRNKKVREYIVETAIVSSLSEKFFSQFENDEAKSDMADNNEWQADPLGISVPWEEKHGTETKKKKKKPNVKRK